MSAAFLDRFRAIVSRFGFGSEPEMPEVQPPPCRVCGLPSSGTIARSVSDSGGGAPFGEPEPYCSAHVDQAARSIAGPPPEPDPTPEPDRAEEPLISPDTLNEALHGWVGNKPPKPWRFRAIENELARLEKERHA